MSLTPNFRIPKIPLPNGLFSRAWPSQRDPGFHKRDQLRQVHRNRAVRFLHVRAQGVTHKMNVIWHDQILADPPTSHLAKYRVNERMRIRKRQDRFPSMGAHRHEIGARPLVLPRPNRKVTRIFPPSGFVSPHVIEAVGGFKARRHPGHPIPGAHQVPRIQKFPPLEGHASSCPGPHSAQQRRSFRIRRSSFIDCIATRFVIMTAPNRNDHSFLDQFPNRARRSVPLPVGGLVGSQGCDS